MPSIQDVADQINAKLDQINQHTAESVTVGNGIRSDLTQVNGKLGTIDTHLQNGFAQVNAKLDLLDNHLQAGVADLANGLFAIWELQKVTNSILDHQSRQNDTIICLLENTNDLLCGMTRKLTRQLELSGQILSSLQRVEGITERTEPGAAADFDRLAELQEQIRECCPPEEPKPEPCPEACPTYEPKPHRPKGQDWSPPPRPKPIG